MKRIQLSIIFFLLPIFLFAQKRMTLTDAIEIARSESYDSKEAELSYLSSYWSFRQYKATWLPSLNLSGNLMNYNHSIVEARDAQTGRVTYVDNNSLYNFATFSLNQNLPWADGTVSLRSDFSRFDQFDYNETVYNTTPLLLYYNQPLRSYSSMRWNKRIQPLQLEFAKRSYVETMQSLTINVIRYYFNALSAQSNLKQSRNKHKDLSTLYEKTCRKLELGLATKGELLQLELLMLNAEMSISYNKLALENNLFNLFSYLNITDYKDIELVAPTELPDITISSNDVLSRAYANSTYDIEQQLKLLNAQQNLAYVKANNGLQLSLQAQVGLTKSAYVFTDAYGNLKDNEVVGLTFSLPLYDWGLGKGRKRVAKAQLELTRVQVEKANIDFEQEIRTTVMYFNNQAELCKISRRALKIAQETYSMAYKRYEKGVMSVTDFNTANNELESAQAQYLSQLNTYWSYYYAIQRMTHYDYIRNEVLDCDFDELTK